MDVSITEKFQRIFNGLEAGFEGFKLDEQQRKEFVAALAAQYNECLVSEPPSQAETIGAELVVEPPPIPEGMVPIPHIDAPPEELGAFPAILARNLDPALQETNNDASTPAIKYNPKAFMVRKDGVTPRSGPDVSKSAAAAAARMAKMRSIKSLTKCVEKIGTLEQQSLALHSFLSDPKREHIVDSIQSAKDATGIGCMGNIADSKEFGKDD